MLQVINLECVHLKGINLIVNSGECVSLSGPSGSGKTRLLRALADLDIHRGQVLCQGIAQEDIPANEWRQRVGYLPAESAWWFDTVGEHFNAIDKVLFEVLQLREAILKTQISHLSSGERQRLALLRLLSRQPDVLLLDEPTANLDEENRGALEKVVEAYRLKNQASVLWVGHDINQLKRVATRHYVIDVETKQLVET